MKTIKPFVAVDIGNTSTLFAYCSGKRILRQFRARTGTLSVRDLNRLKKAFRGLLPVPFVMASVSPQASNFLKKHIPKVLGAKVFLIGQEIKPPVANRYRNPKQVGMDRLMNAVAVLSLYKRDTIVIDFGTAITLDVVSQRKGYLGGIIAPGIEISLEALFQKTALLPKIRLEHPKGVIGKDTVQSIRIGCSYGIGGLCDRLVELVRRRFERAPFVVATGGYARFMTRYCRSIAKVDPDLVIRGIAETYRASDLS